MGRSRKLKLTGSHAKFDEEKGSKHTGPGRRVIKSVLSPDEWAYCCAIGAHDLDGLSIERIEP